jgi:hypothetical protein
VTYSPPYFYSGLYEEENKSFEIVGEVRHEQLIRKPESKYIYTEGNVFVSPQLGVMYYSSTANAYNQTATGAMIAAQQQIEIARQMAMRKTGRGDGSGVLA